MALSGGPTPRCCLVLSASGVRTGGLGLGSSGDLHEVARAGGSRVGTAFTRGGGTRLFSRPVPFFEVTAEVGDISVVMPDTPPLLLPRVLVAQGFNLRLDPPMMVHILADLHVLGGSIPLCPRRAVLPVPLQHSHEAADNRQAGPPRHVLGAGHAAWLWQCVVVDAQAVRTR